MSVIYTEKYLFTDVPHDLDRQDGWTPDCGGKWDFDPTIVRISSRVWRDGDYSCAVIVGGDDTAFETGILKAGSVTKAQAAVEEWAEQQADKIIAAIKVAYHA